MKRLYYHLKVKLNPKTKNFYCIFCGKQMTESNLSEEPCVLPTVSQSVYDNYRFEISVQNYIPYLLCFTKDETDKRTYYSLYVDKDIYEELNNLIKDSVYKVGSVFNSSGLYSLSEELENFLEENIKIGKITIEKD